MARSQYMGPPPPPTPLCTCYRGDPDSSVCEHLCGEPCDCPDVGPPCRDCVKESLTAYYEWQLRSLRLQQKVDIRVLTDRLTKSLPALQSAARVRERQRHAYPCRWAECQNRVIRSWGYYEWPKVEFCFECQKKGRGDNS